MKIVFKDILQELVKHADALNAKIKKYGRGGKNAKPYEEELYNLEKQLKAPMEVMRDKARSIANERKLKKIDKQENIVNDTLANDEEAL